MAFTPAEKRIMRTVDVAFLVFGVAAAASMAYGIFNMGRNYEIVQQIKATAADVTQQLDEAVRR